MDFISQAWEWLGVLTALIYVYLASKALRSCFIFGLISSVIFTQICFVEHLYFDTYINAYYILMSVLGWFGWSQGAKAVQISSFSNNKLIVISVLIISCSLGLGYLALSFSDAHLPYIDAFTTVGAVVATWMLVRKILQNWLIFALIDFVAIFMYIYKEHYPMALLFLIYTVIAIYGYLNWKKLAAQA